MQQPIVQSSMICAQQFGGNTLVDPVHRSFLLYDNARAHSAPRTQHLRPTLKKSLGRVRFTNDDELVEYVKMYFQKLPTMFYGEGISKLVKRYDKCLIRLRRYVERKQMYSNFQIYNFFGI